MSPPKPRLTLRVGVTGHRPNKFTPDAVARVRPQLASVLKRLRAALDEVHRAYPDAYDGAPPVLRVISPLAEGADRLVADEALALGAELVAPLPFARDFYAQDFAEPQAKTEYAALLQRAVAVVELDGRAGSPDERNRAYATVGAVTVEQCDILIALWDGQLAAGTGGTAEIVDYARITGRPVLWFPVAEANVRPRLLLADRSVTAAAEEALAELVIGRLAPPDDAPRPAVWPLSWFGSGSRPGPRAAYFAEANPRRTLGDLFAWFRDLVTLGGSGQVRPLRTDVPDFAARAHAAAAKLGGRDLAGERLALHYAWIDGLAAYYSALYRSAYLCNYMLAALAVFFAAVHISVAELVSILLILVLTVTGAARGWHGRWIAYRDVAERLRTLRFLRLIAAAPVSAELPRHLGEEKSGRWTQWLYQAVIRDVGLPSVVIDQTYADLARRSMVSEEIDDQLAYHGHNAHRLHQFDHRFHALGNATFVAAAGVCVVNFFAHGLTWLTITLPALGAASLSIRNQGEFARTAERSEHMVKALTELRDELAGAREGAMRHARLVILGQDLAVIMLSETSDWQIVFATRPLGLPA